MALLSVGFTTRFQLNGLDEIPATCTEVRGTGSKNYPLLNFNAAICTD
ncbi:hypothetical protein [Photobacterium sp.]|nr:hypothetical protein [Photobacterium sp.]MDX1302774.1 hypothetical protein [Photobacterium sp.]